MRLFKTLVGDPKCLLLLLCTRSCYRFYFPYTNLIWTRSDTDLYWTGSDTDLYWTGSDTDLYWTGSDTNLYWTGSDTNLYWTGSDTGFNELREVFDCLTTYRRFNHVSFIAGLT